MHYVTENENGRIYIKKFAIEKLVYNYIKNNAPQLKCYYVNYDQSVITIFLTEQAGISASRIEKIQTTLRNYLGNDLGLYVEKINVKLG